MFSVDKQNVSGFLIPLVLVIHTGDLGHYVLIVPVPGNWGKPRSSARNDAG